MKAVPLIVTTVPTGPLGGEKDLTLGLTRRSVALVPVPRGLATAIGPVDAPFGTVAVSCMSDWTAKVVAGTPSNVTLVVPTKPEPVTVTVLPTVVAAGENPAIAGGVSSKNRRKL